MNTRIKQLGLTALLSLTAMSAAAEVTVENAYVRAIPPGQMMSASFMTLKNDAAESVSLIAGHSSIAKSVELHTHTNNGGVMQMRQVDKVDIPANGTATLQPGGFHIMLIGLNKDLIEGQEVDLTLDFSDGSSHVLTLPVKKVMSGMMHHTSEKMPKNEHEHMHHN